MKRALFLDRDGTIIMEPSGDCQVDSLEKLEFLPRVIGSLARIRRWTDFEFVMVTNQDGLGTAAFPESTFWPPHNKMLATLANEGVTFTDILIDRTLPADNAPTRKPRTGLLKAYLQGGYDLGRSFVIGDRLTDIELAKNLGAKAILFSETQHPDAVCSTRDWERIAQLLLRTQRSAVVKRTTRETDIEVQICLDGSGTSELRTGIGFFDHMLEQVARHSGCDLIVRVAGDLHVDEHHTVEDTALVLGEAWLQALGDKRGIERYGFSLPMDDAFAQVALDVSGRPWLVWDAEFRREMIGGLPTELFSHFFKSFTDAARCTLHIRAAGENEHHKIEAIFKAFARTLKMAVRRDEQNEALPSTKGAL